MRILLPALIALAACGGPSRHADRPPVVVAPPPPPPYQVATASTIGPFVADATHVYWSDDTGIYRRPHGADQKSERLFVAAYVSYMAVGPTELFYVDDEYRLRALPLIGGAPREVAALEDSPWFLGTDGAAVWVGIAEQLDGYSATGKRTIELAGASGSLVLAGGAAYAPVRGDETPSLVRIDLASGARTTLSDRELYGDVYAMTMVGDEVLVATSDSVIGLSTKGGQPHRMFVGSPQALAGDGDGYVVASYNALVSHRMNQAPRLIASSGGPDSLPGTSQVALADPYVYYTSSSNETSEVTLRAAVREVGLVMLRLPIDSSMSTFAVAGEAVFAGLEDEEGMRLAQIGTRRTRTVTRTGWIDTIAADDSHVVYASESILYGVDLPSGSPAGITELVNTPVLTVHKGRVYWGDGTTVRAAGLPADESFAVADALPLGDDMSELYIGAIAFAADHLYFVIPYGDPMGVARVDEQRQIDMLWRWDPTSDDGILDPGLVAVGDAIYVHDGMVVRRIPLDGSAPTRVFGNDLDTVIQLYAAGDHLIAWTRGDGDQVVEIPKDGGKPRVVWSSALDSFSVYAMAVGPGHVYVYVSELMSIVKIPL